MQRCIGRSGKPRWNPHITRHITQTMRFGRTMQKHTKNTKSLSFVHHQKHMRFFGKRPKTYKTTTLVTLVTVTLFHHVKLVAHKLFHMTVPAVCPLDLHWVMASQWRVGSKNDKCKTGTTNDHKPQILSRHLPTNGVMCCFVWVPKHLDPKCLLFCRQKGRHAPFIADSRNPIESKCVSLILLLVRFTAARV